jgi:hypothetical protein
VILEKAIHNLPVDVGVLARGLKEQTDASDHFGVRHKLPQRSSAKGLEEIWDIVTEFQALHYVNS